MPKVSICIPAYKPDYFELALRSALAQSYRDVEIIVSDDCPNGSIGQICDNYGSYLTYSRNPDPSQSNNIKRLVSMANGKYIKFLFDDDIIFPFCVEYLLDLLESPAAQNAKLAFSPRYFIDDRNKTKDIANFFNIKESPILVPGREFIRLTAMHHVNLIGEFSTTLFKRSDCFDENGDFCLFRTYGSSFDGILDLSAWLELAKSGGFVGHQQILSCFRVHNNSSSNPELTNDFIYCITYYEHILKYAIDNRILTDCEKRLSFQNLIKLYKSWAGRYPALLERIEYIRLLERSLTC